MQQSVAVKPFMLEYEWNDRLAFTKGEVQVLRRLNTSVGLAVQYKDDDASDLSGMLLLMPDRR